MNVDIVVKYISRGKPQVRRFESRGHLAGVLKRVPVLPRCNSAVLVVGKEHCAAHLARGLPVVAILDKAHYFLLVKTVRNNALEIPLLLVGPADLTQLRYKVIRLPTAPGAPKSRPAHQLAARLDNKLIGPSLRGHRETSMVSGSSASRLLLKALLLHSEGALLSEALYPRLQTHLNVWHPHDVAAVIYLLVVLILILVYVTVHAIFVSLGVLAVLFDELDLLSGALPLDLNDLIIELLLLERLLHGQLLLTFLKLHGLQLFEHVPMRDVALRQDYYHVLKVVLGEAPIARDLHLSDEEPQTRRIVLHVLCDEFGMLLQVKDQALHVVHAYETCGIWIVFLPQLLKNSDVALKDFEAFLFVGVRKSVEDNGDEQVQEDEVDDDLEQDEVYIGYRCPATIWLASVGHY